jgi:hypothetical protein
MRIPKIPFLNPKKTSSPKPKKVEPSADNDRIKRELAYEKRLNKPDARRSYGR